MPIDLNPAAFNFWERQFNLMPASDTLEFNCPNCQVSLLVPKSKAGISGPCPHCEASITSPSPIPAPLRNNPIPPAPEPRRSIPSRESLPIAPRKKTPSPPKSQPDDIAEDQKWSDDEEEEKKGGGCWLTLLFLLFLIVAAYFVLSFLSLVPDWRIISSKLFPKAHKIEQTPTKPSKESGTIPTPPTPIVVKPPEDPKPGETSPTIDPFEEGEDENTPRQSLKKFLAAKNLEERLPFMTGNPLSENELRQTILSKSFPEAHPPQVESKLTSPGNDSSTSYYTVSFRTPLPGDLSAITMKVVSSAANNTPKVDTAFFLDLLEAPVIKLNQNISSEPLTFQAIIEASAYCFDDVPNSDSMARLIFYRELDAKASPLATAYLAQNSPIFLNLKNRNNMGTRFPGTATVKWNPTLDPSKPFLEVISLKAPRLK